LSAKTIAPAARPSSRDNRDLNSNLDFEIEGLLVAAFQDSLQISDRTRLQRSREMIALALFSSRESDGSSYELVYDRRSGRYQPTPESARLLERERRERAKEPPE
jgi:hypothetical protein